MEKIKKLEWIAARSMELLTQTDDPALAALPAGPAEIPLVLAQIEPLPGLAGIVDQMRASTPWEEHGRRVMLARLRAQIERALLDERLELQMPLVELARRCAEVTVAVAERKPDLEIGALAARLCAGSQGAVGRWVCPDGHGGVLVASGVEARGVPCPVCSKPVRVVRED